MSQHFQDERVLVEACRSGDRNAQFRLYTQYSRAMYNICLRMVRNEADAEDLLQNSFVDIFRKLNSYRQEATIGAWIKRIVINNCINFLKRRRLDTVNWDGSFPLPDEGENGDQDDLDDNRETVNAIKNAMWKLPDGYRVVFSLYLLEGYDHKEIAEILGITEATSKSQFSRARKKLQQLVKEEMLQP